MRFLPIVLLVLGCVPRATRPVRDLEPSVIARVAPADRYTSRTASPTELRVAFERSLPPSARALLRYEPALEGVAHAIGETWSSTSQPPAASLVSWLHWRAGIVGRHAGSRMLHSEGRASEARFTAELQRWARELSEGVKTPTAFAVVRFDTPLGDEVQVLALADDTVEVELPRAAHAGAPLTFRGRFKAPSQKLTLFIEDDERSVRSVVVPLDAEGRFSVSLPAPSSAGRRFLELMNLPPSGNRELPWARSVMLAPLLVDVPEPAQAEPELVTPKPNPPELASWGPQVRAAWDARRKALGVGPLEASEPLDAIAKQYAVQFAANSDAPPDPQLVERVNAAGIVSREVNTHRAETEYLDELVWLQWMRPAYRVSLLSGAPKHGLAFEPRGDGSFAFAEVIAQQVGKLDAYAEALALRARFAELRAATDKPPLASDAKLDEALTAVVTRACASGEAPTKTALGEVLKQANLVGASTWLNYTAARVLVEDLAGAVDELPRRDASHLALAVCQFEAGPKKGQELMLVLLVDARK